MESRNTESVFKYTYSAKEQEEIKRIRQKYQAPEEDAMTKLRKLDGQATKKATVVSSVFGVIGALVMGMGMSLIMTDLATVLGMTVMVNTIVGIITGVIGLVLVIMAYPIYLKVLKGEREKIAPEIIRLTDALMK